MAFNFFQKFIGRRAQRQGNVAQKIESARIATKHISQQESRDPEVRGNETHSADRRMTAKGNGDYASIVALLPHLSEKATRLQEARSNKLSGPTYAFRVSRRANKATVKKAIESRYDVRVSCVHSINTHGRTRRRGSIIGHQPSYKKALITLQKNYSIEEI